jgi:signal transduction histidine kinase
LSTKNFKLPVTIRLPLTAAMMIFFAAVASTQTAIFFMGRQADRQVETLGQVYLDGLSAALLPHVLEGNVEGVRSTLNNALSFHQGVLARQLAFIGRQDALTTRVSRDESNDNTVLPFSSGEPGNGVSRTNDGSIWIWRELHEAGSALGIVAAKLDISVFTSERGILRIGLLVFDLLFSGACAILGFFMVRRVQRPVALVAHRLYDAALGVLRPIEASLIPSNDIQAERMIHSFNAMAHASTERENMLAHLAEQQREADIGRLAATMAHEVRNPLGGMRTAISTLKRFGDRTDTRDEAVAFLDRGVLALQGVVNATLENYRSQPDWRPLSRKDFEDLRLLVGADGESRGVKISTEVDLPPEVAVAASEVRQVVLNLLLNSIRASPRGGTVELSARIMKRELVISVRDEGSGLSPEFARAIEAGESTHGPGLGVAVVIRLVERLNGRVSIDSNHGTGTSIALRFPI